MDFARDLALRHTFIGAARGMGLRIGIEMVRDRQTREPAPEVVARVIGRMKAAHHILLSGERPDHDFSKINPTAVFSIGDCKKFLSVLDQVLGEGQAGSGGIQRSSTIRKLAAVTSRMIRPKQIRRAPSGICTMVRSVVSTVRISAPMIEPI